MYNLFLLSINIQNCVLIKWLPAQFIIAFTSLTSDIGKSK